MAAKEVLAGAVLDLHEQGDDTVPLGETMAGLADTAMRVKDERDQAVTLLRRALSLAEIGAKGPFKSDVRDFLARIGEPSAIHRGERLTELGRAISAFDPTPAEAEELVLAVQSALQENLSGAMLFDADPAFDTVRQALTELQESLRDDGKPDECDLSRADRQRRDEEATS